MIEQRHKNCKNPDCETCLEDLDRLNQYLKKECDYIDMTWEYRKWFDDRGIDSETEYGWPKPLVFDPININAFIKYWNEE